MDDEAMLLTMRRCGNITPSHRRIVRSIASSSIASPHSPSHRLIAHRIASSCNEHRRERCVTPPSHQRAAWIFNTHCVGKVREPASDLCASSRASTSAFVVELTCVLRWICMTLLLVCDITIAASAREPVASAVTL